MREKKAKVGEKRTKIWKVFRFFKKNTFSCDYHTKERSRIGPDHVFKEERSHVNLWRRVVLSCYSDSSALHSYCLFTQVHKPKNNTQSPVLSVKDNETLVFWKNAPPSVVYLICLVQEFYLKALITHPISTDSGEILPTFPL